MWVYLFIICIILFLISIFFSIIFVELINSWLLFCLMVRLEFWSVVKMIWFWVRSCGEKRMWEGMRW